MFPHPVVAFLAYLEAPNSILAKKSKNPFMFIKSFDFQYFPCFLYSPLRHLGVTL